MVPSKVASGVEHRLSGQSSPSSFMFALRDSVQLLHSFARADTAKHHRLGD